MSTSLISSVMQFVTPDLIAKIASGLGLDRTAAQRAISAAVPAILASLASLASKPGGIQQLASALAQQKPGAIDDVVGAIGGSGQAAHSEEGADTLSTLMGSGGLNALASAIGGFAGTSSGKSETLLGLLAPIVMGAIGQQQRKTGLDAGGIASLLASQKDQIAAALPSGFASQLRDSGFLDTLDGTLRRSTEAASGFARGPGDPSDEILAMPRTPAAAASQGTTTWPYWLAAAAILAALGWSFLPGHDGTQLAEAPNPATTPPRETVGRAAPQQAAIDLSSQAIRSVDGMRSTLTGITDAASAQAAMPKLRQMSADLDAINNAAAQLPPQGRALVATQIGQVMPAFEQLCERVLAIPGVSAVAKPVIDTMRTRLDSMSRA